MSNIFFNPSDYTIKLTCNSDDTFIHNLRFSNLSFVKTVNYETMVDKNYGEVILSDTVGNHYNVSVECYNVLNGTQTAYGNQDITQIFNDGVYNLGKNDAYLIIHFKTPIILGTLNYLTFKLDKYDENNELVEQDGEIGVYQDECLYSYNTEDYRKNSVIIVFKDIEKHNIFPNEIETFLGIFNENEGESLGIPIKGGSKKNDDVFIIRFSKIRLGQTIQTENLEVEGCEFVRDVETHEGIRGYKVFKDTATNKEVILNIYNYNNISHDLNGHVLQNYKYLINHTDYDSLNIECKVFQNGVDLSGRSIIYNQTLSNDECYNVDLTTLYNGFLQTSSIKKIAPFRLQIPYQYETDVKYKILILLESDDKKTLSLYNARFQDLTFNKALSTSSADYDNTEVIQFTNTSNLNNSNVTCEVYESSKKYINVNPFLYDSSSLFDPLKVNSNGETQVLSAISNYFYYAITFNSKLPKKIIKSFQVGVGENNTNFECNVKFKLYDQLDNKLLFETELYNETRELLTPFKNYE